MLPTAGWGPERPAAWVRPQRREPELPRARQRRTGRTCIPSPQPLPARFPSPDSSSSSPVASRRPPVARHRGRQTGNRRLTVSLPAQPTLLRKAAPLYGPDSGQAPPPNYRIGPSLKMSMKLSVVAALPSARSSSAVLPPAESRQKDVPAALGDHQRRDAALIPGPPPSPRGRREVARPRPSGCARRRATPSGRPRWSR